MLTTENPPTSTQCDDCGAAITYAPLASFPRVKPCLCDACGDKRHQTELQERAALEHNCRLMAFRSLCPSNYQDTNPDLLRGKSGKLDRILEWTPTSGRGLILLGPPRSGKTRAIWLLLRKLFVDAGITHVRTMTHGQFAKASAGAVADGPVTCLNWFNDLANADVLFIDDLGKHKFTDGQDTRAESELFDLIEHRMSHRKPMLFTTNFNGNALVSRFMPDRGPAIIERLRESCESISLP